MPRRIACSLLLALGPACGSESEPPPDVFVGPDTVDGCLTVGCFDEDFCTDDFCQADGTCVHVPRNPFGACQTAAHCDDDNPCTEDLCALDECGLMRCQTGAWREGCQPCMFGCDDGDPCTVESCDDEGICVHAARDPHCDPMCRQDLAMSVESAQWVYDPGGSTMYFTGVGAAQNGANCSAGQCVCTSALGLSEYGQTLPVRGGVGTEGSPWNCAIEACEVGTVTCDPFAEGVGYIAWGQLRYLQPRDARGAAPQPSDASSADTAMPPEVMPNATIDAFEVQGWCLSTRWDYVPGSYQATFESDGRRATFALQLVSQMDGNVGAFFGACAGCAEVGLVDGQASQLAQEYGVVAFPLELSEGPAFARLFARADRFVGDVKRADGGFVGMLTLVRDRL